jgi:hypothetical protein
MRSMRRDYFVARILLAAALGLLFADPAPARDKPTPVKVVVTMSNATCELGLADLGDSPMGWASASGSPFGDGLSPRH